MNDPIKLFLKQNSIYHSSNYYRYTGLMLMKLPGMKVEVMGVAVEGKGPLIVEVLIAPLRISPIATI
jgi:hypothetical protein